MEQARKILRGIWWLVLTDVLIREADQIFRMASPLTGYQTGRYFFDKRSQLSFKVPDIMICFCSRLIKVGFI